MAKSSNIKKIKVREILIKKAKIGQIIFYSEVMEKCHTSRRWIGEILILVGEYCKENKEPILTALVERKNGGIGDGYNYVVNNFGADPDYKKEQKKCFKYWKNKI